MTKRMRTLAAMALTLALLVAIVAVNPRSSNAANLTGGNYTYLINGEEITFTFDPVVRKDGLLLPLEVFTQFGVTADGGQGSDITLFTKDVTAKLTIGTTNLDLSGKARKVNTAPLRLNGRLFLPADLLREFGVDLIQDGNMIIMKSYLTPAPDAVPLTDSEWNILMKTRGFTQNIKADAGIYVYAQFALLNEKMISATNMGITYGQRVKLYNLLKTNTLVYVKLSNTASRAGGMLTTGTFLVDDQRRQYEVTEVVDIGNGMLDAKLAPGADRAGVLVYPKYPNGTRTLSVYYDNNQAVMGTFLITKE